MDAAFTSRETEARQCAQRCDVVRVGAGEDLLVAAPFETVSDDGPCCLHGESHPVYCGIEQARELLPEEDRPDDSLVELDHPSTIGVEIVRDELGRVGMITEVSTVRLGLREPLEGGDVLRLERAQPQARGAKLHALMMLHADARLPATTTRAG